jgi:hypothetical protein
MRPTINNGPIILSSKCKNLRRYVMMKVNEIAVMRAVALCFKPYLKPEEAMIYCNLGRTRLALKCEEYGVYKNASGYYKKEDLDLILSGASTKIEEAAKKVKLGR